MTPTQSLLNAVHDLHDDVVKQLSDVASQIDTLDCKVEKIDGRISKLETDAVVATAVAATKATMLAEQRVADQAHVEETQAHVLTSLQRKGLWVAAIGSVAALLTGLVDILAHAAGVWH
jgi:hypothetical protein